MPDRIANAPELVLGLELFYLAFLDLTSCREQGFTEGPISWFAIDRYAKIKGFEGEQLEDLFFLIQQMDQAYLDFKARKLKAKIQEPPAKK